MKTKILEHVRNVCGFKNPDNIYSLFDFPVHLGHLMFALSKNKLGFSFDLITQTKSYIRVTDRNLYAQGITRKKKLPFDGRILWDYDLQKTVEQNLEDEALCKLLVEVLNIK